VQGISLITEHNIFLGGICDFCWL